MRVSSGFYWTITSELSAQFSHTFETFLIVCDDWRIVIGVHRTNGNFFDFLAQRAIWHEWISICPVFNATQLLLSFRLVENSTFVFAIYFWPFYYHFCYGAGIRRSRIAVKDRRNSDTFVQWPYKCFMQW